MGNVVKDFKPETGRQWQIVRARQDGSDLEAKSRSPSPGYLVVYVTCPDNRKAILSAWAVGGMKGWLNGAVAFDVREFGRYPFCGNRRFTVARPTFARHSCAFRMGQERQISRPACHLPGPLRHRMSPWLGRQQHRRLLSCLNRSVTTSRLNRSVTTWCGD